MTEPYAARAGAAVFGIFRPPGRGAATTSGEEGSAMAVVTEAVPAPRERQRPAVTIVPRPALPIIGLVLAGLIVAIATNDQWALDWFHVVGGGLWTALDLFLGLVLGPIMGTMSIPSRVELSSRLMPKLLVIMPTVVTMTLGAGFQLARHLGNLAPNYPHHDLLVASYAIVGVMAVIALGLLEPANLAVLFELRRPQPNGARIQRLMKVFIYTAGITGVMQIATLVIMTKLAAG
jgi:hypothetical protein